MFASNEGLRKVQKIRPEEGSKLQEAIEELIAIYPSDIAQFYSANYENVLVEKVNWKWSHKYILYIIEMVYYWNYLYKKKTDGES